MEPLSTYFRISPTLLMQSFNTPRSNSSSSFSSPSFADHQTGLKVYRESPASLTSAHQDNPLFEGFPLLPASDRKTRTSGDASTDAITQTQGDSPKLQEQLHHLVTVLEYALKLHSDDGLPDDLAPQLADELEAVARKLKEKEREAPAERQLRAKVHLALTGAEATIRKLRATPAHNTPASTRAAARRRRNDPAATSPTTTAPPGSCGSDIAALSTVTPCGGGAVAAVRGSLRDSVCRQLLQSPSSSMSPLSWTGPTVVVCTPMYVTDDASMASPKELPTDHHRSQRSQLTNASSCEHVLIPTGLTPPARHTTSPTSSGAATSSSFQPPLYNWMKAVLASASKHDGSGASDGGGRRGRSVLQSPIEGCVAGEGLAAVVRAALSNTTTPPLVYGSPLYRRIQRLLAEQRSPSPLRHPAAHSGTTQTCGDSVEQTPVGGRSAGYGAGAPVAAGSTPAWGQEVEVDSLPVSHRFSDTSSSCNTPIMTTRDKMAALPFRSSVSPFGPTLRERFATRPCTAAPDASSAQRPAAASRPAAAPPSATPPSAALPDPRSHDHPEAAEVLAELGLDLQLDPEAAANISNLEVLEHVERWAREQFIAAKRALQASKEAALEEGVEFSGSAGSSNCVDDVSPQALVDVAIQTESLTDPCRPAGEPKSQERGPASRLSAARKGPAATWAPVARQPVHAKGKADAGIPHVQFLDKQPGKEEELESCRHTAADDSEPDVCSPSHGDQSKRSPLKGQDALEATSASTVKADGTAGRSPTLGIWPRKRIADAGGIPARRGLFRLTPGKSSSAQSNPDGEAPQRLRNGDDGGGGSSISAANHMRSPGSVAGPAPRPLGPSSRAQGTALKSPAAASSTGQISSLQDPSSDELPPDVLFTPGMSHAGGSKAASTGRHFSRVCSEVSGSGRGRAGGLSGATPSININSDINSCAGIGPLAGGGVGHGGLSPITARDLRDSADDTPSARGDDSAELVPELLFTPGNIQPGAKAFGRVRAVVPFRLDGAIRFEDEEETEDGGASVKTLSSISSVSIIGSEPAIPGDETAEEGQRSARAAESQASDGGPRKAAARPAVSHYLCGFLSSLLPCAHGSEAR